jgi:hypothetical protein
MKYKSPPVENRAELAAPPEDESAEPQPILAEPKKREPSGSAMVDASLFKKRYKDGYAATKVIASAGGAVKVFGVVVGILIALVALGIGDWSFKLGGLVSALLVGLSTYLSGVFLSAQGQLLSATLDVAVNTSSLLDNAEKAKLMEFE